MPNILVCKATERSSSGVALKMVETQLSPKNETLSHTNPPQNPEWASAKNCLAHSSWRPATLPSERLQIRPADPPGISHWDGVERGDTLPHGGSRRGRENWDPCPESRFVSEAWNLQPKSSRGFLNTALCFQPHPQSTSLLRDFQVSLRLWENWISHLIYPPNTGRKEPWCLVFIDEKTEVLGD